VPLPMDLVIARELEIYGSHGMAARDYPAMLRMVVDGTRRPGTGYLAAGLAAGAAVPLRACNAVRIAGVMSSVLLK